MTNDDCPVCGAKVPTPTMSAAFGSMGRDGMILGPAWEAEACANGHELERVADDGEWRPKANTDL